MAVGWASWARRHPAFGFRASFRWKISSPKAENLLADISLADYCAPMSNPDDIRITDLEIQSAHLSRTVDELNEVVTRQADEIKSLTRRVEMLMQRAAASEAAEGEAAPLADQVPPHW